MKKLITTTLFVLIVSALASQDADKRIFVGSVISDTTSIDSIDYQTSLTSILKSKNKIEIRFIISPSLSHTTYTILTLDTVWSAKNYFYLEDANTLVYEDITEKNNYDSVFSRLVANNIFSLISQERLNLEKAEYDPRTDEFSYSGMGIGDGTCYRIEFKIGSKYRRYDFCNPDEYADFYSHVYELRNLANIVEIFNELVNQ